MIVVGVVGGIGSGKSLVARRLGELGAEVLDADRAGHQVLGEPEVKEAIRRRWGDAVFDDQGRVDRGRLAAIVFAAPPEGPKELAYLEQITHPRIRARLQQALQRAAEQKRHPVLVLDAALLLEAGWDDLCDKVLFVDAPSAVRRTRAQRRGWTAAEFAAREAAQASLEVKRARADIVLDNSSTPETTYQQLESLWQGLTSARSGRRAKP